VAKELFAREGVAAVTMNDIAQAAEVGKGTLYRRFANKGELCLALMDEQLAEFQNVMLARMRQMSAAGTPYLTQLEHFLDALVHFTEAHNPYLCEAQRAALVETAMPHFWQYLTIRGLLQTAVNAGELPSAVDLDFLSGALLAPVSPHYYRFQRQERGFSVARISAGLQLLVSSLRHLER
jgi:AcrR family transcriptional regulator